MSVFTSPSNSIRNGLLHDTVIPFNQKKLISSLDKSEHIRLYEIQKKFKGLCEIICNHLLNKNLIGSANDKNFFKRHVTVEILENQSANSHILRVYSIFYVLIAFFFGWYKDNIFSICEQSKLIQKSYSGEKRVYRVNSEVLEKGLSSICEGDTLKVMVFSRSLSFGFKGHSLLIKKENENQFIFFDPNQGEFRNQTFSQICDHLNKQLKKTSAKNLLLIKGDHFLREYEDRILKK